ncbi:MAG: flagellar filament capping protein FliD [Selenomonadaceae bacterium]|nr:flagellar filament capping protein FliD [Selenomonadaceae bacterium]
MPTVNAIIQQKDLTAEVSSRLFNTDVQSAAKSVLISAPMNTANDFVNSTFGVQSNISEMLGTYEEEKEAFTNQFDKTLASLKESSDRIKYSAQVSEDNITAIGMKAQENEDSRHESAKVFSDAAREQIRENEQNRSERGKVMEEISHERLQNSLQSQKQNTVENFKRNTEKIRASVEQMEHVAEIRENNAESIQTQQENREITQDKQSTAEYLAITRKRNQTAAQTQRANTEQFAKEYMTAETTETNLESVSDENSNAALSNVRNFVTKFNDAVSYFNENRGMSNRMSALAGSLGNTSTLAQSLDSVGISVNDNGTLAVDETKLSEAISQNSDGVNSLLGQNGLIGQLDRTVELANSQRDNMFPNVNDYVNDRRTDPTESLYSSNNNQTAAITGGNAWNFVNMFT